MTLVSIGWSQFVEINVDLDMRRISEGDRQLLNSLREDIEQYYLYTQFSPDVIDLDMVVNIHLVLESEDDYEATNAVEDKIKEYLKK